MISKNSKEKSLNNDRGQVLIEYILLLLIGITIAHLLASKLTGFSDDPEEQGVIIKRWMNIWSAIGKDTPDN